VRDIYNGIECDIKLDTYMT